MSSKGSHNRITVAKHVYLRTQQRRLRHVKCVIIRNLTLPESLEDRGAPLKISVYFTLHPLYDESKVLYQSDPVCQSYNPSWESVQFSSITFGKHSSLNVFTIKVWVQLTSCSRFPSPVLFSRDVLPGSVKGKGLLAMKTKAEEEEEEASAKLAFEGTIDLSDLVYLGSLVNKDGSGYPPNSVIVGMFEGYFSNPAVGGIPPSPPIAHSLVDLLPPRSLLEVTKTDVMDSYINSMLQMILSKQERLNRATADANAAKTRVESYLREQEEYFKRKREVERLKTRVGLLQRLVQHRERLEKEESERDEEHDKKVNEMEAGLRLRQKELREKETLYQQDKENCSKNREKLLWTRKCRTLRQRNMIYDLSETFFIKEVGETSFTICQVILPNADNLDQANNMEQYGVALGYTAHLVSQLGHVLQVPLQYPIKPCGSKSTISDHISEEVVIDAIKEFPLYWKGTEKALFQYAVHLLNKNIGQLKQHCGYPGSRGMLKKTLPNLKNLLDRLIRDYFLSPPPSSAHLSNRLTWSTTEPMSTSYSPTLIGNNDHLPQGEFFSRGEFSGQSSRNSSLVATTLGLSLTPPSISPHTSLEHENFHSLAQGGSSPSTPSQISAGNSSLDDFGGLVMKISRGSNSSFSSKGNGGSVDDDFQAGFTRTRSNRIAGYHHQNVEVQQTGDAGSSSHEQLHYSIPGIPTADVMQESEEWRQMREKVLRQKMASVSSTLGIPGENDEEQWLEVVGGEENGDDFISVPHPSADPSRTPTPPSQLEQQKFPKSEDSDTFSGQTVIYESVSGEKTEHSGNEGDLTAQNDNYATLFVKHPNSKFSGDQHYSNDGKWEEVTYDLPSRGGYRIDHDHDHGSNSPRDTIRKLKSATLSGPRESNSHGNIETSLDVFAVDRRAPQLESGPKQKEGRVSPDPGNRKRSSPLVGTKELHRRMVLVEAREHNLVPVLPDGSSSSLKSDQLGNSTPPDSSKCDSNSVVFSPKGFSKFSFSGEEAPPTSLQVRMESMHGEQLHVSNSRQTSSWMRENGKHRSSSQGSVPSYSHHSPRSPRTESQGSNGGRDHLVSTNDAYANSRHQHLESGNSSATLQVPVNGARVLELSNLATSSTPPPLYSHTHSKLTGTSKSLPFSSHESGSASNAPHTVTNSSPPPLMAPMSPDPAIHFQRPRGYAMRNRGVSMPHVLDVNVQEEKEEARHTPSAASPGNKLPGTHQGLSGSDKDNQFLEDWIDGF